MTFWRPAASAAESFSHLLEGPFFHWFHKVTILDLISFRQVKKNELNLIPGSTTLGTTPSEAATPRQTQPWLCIFFWSKDLIKRGVRCIKHWGTLYVLSAVSIHWVTGDPQWKMKADFAPLQCPPGRAGKHLPFFTAHHPSGTRPGCHPGMSFTFLVFQMHLCFWIVQFCQSCGEKWEA